jgi:hypothetical protein
MAAREARLHPFWVCFAHRQLRCDLLCARAVCMKNFPYLGGAAALVGVLALLNRSHPERFAQALSAFWSMRSRILFGVILR